MKSIVASMATIPERIEAFEKMVASILPQVDRLNVCLNRYTEVPSFLQHKKVIALVGEDHRAAGKFRWCEEVDGYHFTVDDDILFPPDYVERMICEIERWQGKALVCAFGMRYKFPFNHPLCGDTFQCWDETPGAWIHSPGTGVCAYDATKFRVLKSDFAPDNSQDPRMGIVAQKQKAPVWCIPHAKGWLVDLWKEVEGDLGDSVWMAESRAGYANRKAIIGSWPVWTLYQIDDSGAVVAGEALKYDESAVDPNAPVQRILLRKKGIAPKAPGSHIIEP